MAGEGAKLRVAMAVFEEMARLNGAADALIALGLDPADLCFAAARADGPLDPADGWTAARRSSPMTWFQHRGPDAPVPADEQFAAKAASLMTVALGATSTPRTFRFPASDVWSAINTQLAGGAMLLVARVPNASMQDHAVRALLRYSRQPVHAEEFFAAADEL